MDRNSRTIFVHVGMPKTGTSAIQDALEANRNVLLAEAGLLYPKSGVAKNTNESGHHNIPRSLRRLAKFDPACGGLPELCAEIAQSPASCVVVSSEGFWATAASDFPAFARCIDALANVGTVQPIVFLRTEDSLTESHYLQILRSGEAKLTFPAYRDAWRDRVAGRRTILDLFRRLRAEPPRLVLYDRRTDSVELFAAAMGGGELPPIQRDGTGRTNVRWGINHYRAVYRALASDAFGGAERQRRLRALGRFAQTKLEPGPAQFRLIDGDLSAAMKRESWQVLAPVFDAHPTVQSAADLEELWMSEDPGPRLSLEFGALDEADQKAVLDRITALQDEA